MAQVQPVLADVLYEGARLRLRPVTSADAPAAFPLIHRERRVLDWLCWQGPDTVAELASAYSTWRSVTPAGANYHLAIERIEGDVLLGTAALRFEDHPFLGDLGYWLGVEHHGQGYGTELVGLLARLGFGPLEATALTAEVFPGNAGSEKVLRRNGFRLERDVAPAAVGAPVPGAPPDPARPRRLFLAMPADLPSDAVVPSRAVAVLG